MFDPFFVVVVLVLAGLALWKRRRLAFLLVASALLILLILSLPSVAGALTRSLELQFVDRDIGRMPSAQALVVLGGTIHMPSAEHHSSGVIESSDRLLLAFRIYRAGKAPVVICSGGNNPFTEAPGLQAEAVFMSQLLEEWGLPATVVEMENGSINTHENALFSYRMLSSRGIKRIILVTSALHMPRAAAAFRKAGFDVIPAPADFRSGWGGKSHFIDWIPNAHSMDDSKRALHEWLGLWVYRVRGWA